MGKKKGHAAHENLERWVVSYADFMTLLFATFTAMFALAQAKLDEQKEQEVMAGIRQGFQEQSLINGIKSIIEGKSAPNDAPNPLSPEKGAAGDGMIGDFKSLVPQKGVEEDEQNPVGEEGLQTVVKQLAEKIEQISKELKAAADEVAAKAEAQKGQGAGGQGAGSSAGAVDSAASQSVNLEVDEAKKGVRLRLNDKLLFASGTANLRPESKKAMAAIAQSLKKYMGNYLLQVEGHTDSQPLSTAQFPSNWELSTARASAVVRFLINEQGFPKSRLSAAGFAETQPLASNATAKGRSTNRRIEFLVYTDPNAVAKAQETIITPKKRPETPKPVVSGGENGSFIPGSNRLSKQLVKSVSNHEPSDGPVRVILKRTDPTTGSVINTQVKPTKPMVASEKAHH